MIDRYYQTNTILIMHYWTNNYVWLIQYRLRSTVQCQEICCKYSRAKALLWTVGSGTSYLRVEAVHVLIRARQHLRPWFVWIESPEREWGSGSGAERCSALYVRWCPALEKRQGPRRVEVGHCLLWLHLLDLWTSHYETCSTWAVVVSYFSFFSFFF